MSTQEFRILVADDVYANRLLLRRILEREGLSVIEAENGTETLELFKEPEFDIALLDVMMPDIDGFTICKTVRERFSTRDLPILFITAKTQDQDFQEGFDVGANDYITKPVNSTILLARLNAQIRFLSASRALKRTYEELVHTKRMETVGLFATGVAHNFNNILGTILGCAELIELHSKGNEKLLRTSSLILKAARKGADLTESLITFARPTENRVCLHPVDTIRSASKLIPSLSASMLKLEVEPPDGTIPAVAISPVDLAQVTIELLRNAVDALTQPGVISVKIRAARVPATEFPPFGAAAVTPPAASGADEDGAESEREVVEIAISDPGKGMTSEQLEEVFAPFYSTKNTDRLMGIALDGSGLGLSRVYNIVSASGGTVRFVDSSSAGTTVVVTIPALAPGEVEQIVA